MPGVSAVAIAGMLSFTSVAVPLVAPEIDVIPGHPAVSAGGWVGFLSQDPHADDGKRCEVSVWHLESGTARAAYRAPCEKKDVFYNLLPAANGSDPELVALRPDGVARVYPGARETLIRQTTLAIVAPVTRSPGPKLWLEPKPGETGLELALPGIGDLSIWRRAVDPEPTVPGWIRRQRFRLDVDARYNPRIGRDSLYPDFHLLSHLRMPKWEIGRIDTTGAPVLLSALENVVTASRPDDDSEVFRIEKTLFADDPDGTDPRLVRGNRIADVDGDGQLDVALVAARGGVTHLETALDVWFGPLADRLQGAPDTSFRGSGAAVGTELTDVDRDHTLEAMRPRLEVSVAALVRILLFGEVQVAYDFFDVVRGRHDGQQPFCTFTRTFPVDLEGLSAKAAPLFTLDGDFDGDGMADVLSGEGTKGYSILGSRRAENGRWCVDSEDPTPIPVEKPEAFVVADLDGDSRSDLVVIRAADGRRSTVTLLLSSMPKTTSTRSLP